MTVGVQAFSGLFCHPEPAKTAKDLSRGYEITRIIERSVVNPETTIPIISPGVCVTRTLVEGSFSALRLLQDDSFAQRIG
jgi:hypothetical protein